jgi:hypothetical protein
MIAAGHPPGTVMQWRLATTEDPGSTIARHVRMRLDAGATFEPACRIHDLTLTHLGALTASGAAGIKIETLWVRVPVRHPNDAARRGPAAFLAELARASTRYGLSAPLRAWKATSATTGDGVLRRLLEDEMAGAKRSEAVYRRVESDCPFTLKRFAMGDLWRAIYLGHRENERGVPTVPEDPTGMVLSDYLCGERIDGSGWYRLHGDTPVTMVSMMRPPQPCTWAGITRAFHADPRLTFRHTLIVEFVVLDHNEAVKKLEKRQSAVNRTTRRADGRERPRAAAVRATSDMHAVQMDLTVAGAELVAARVTVLVYGPPARTRDELQRSLEVLKRRSELVRAAVREMPGADAAEEAPEALQALYERYLPGELDPSPTGREIEEVADSLATLVPDESPWRGSARPHSVWRTTRGTLTGLNIFDSRTVESTVGFVIGAMGAGKSVLIQQIACAVLASIRGARVRAIDRGESFGPMVAVLGGRHIRFDPDDRRPLNVWDYPGLEAGEPPGEVQVAFVVNDLKNLARVPDTDLIAEMIITEVVKKVYQNEVPRNVPGVRRHEPTLSHWLLVNKSYP